MAHRIIPPYIMANENQLLKSEYDFNMYSKLLSLITNLNDSRPAQTIKRHHLNLVDWIIQITPKLVDDEQFIYDLQTRCRWILSGRIDYPICRFCHKPFGIHRNMPIRYDYSEWCSNKCRQTDPIVVARTKATKLKNHGDENYCNTEKIRQTFIAHYGVSNPNKCQSVREKIEDTCLKNYGVKCVLQSLDIQQKIQQTNIERRGVAYALSDPNVRAKGIQTWIEHYGVSHPYKSPMIKQKAKETFIEHYGVDNNMKSKEGYAYWQKCFIAKYGVDNPSKHAEIRKKFRRKYLYNSIYFDSGPELAFYIWLQDNNFEFEYQPKDSFEYEYAGKKHFYFADFKINDVFFEIKGDHFFDKSGKMICPFRNKTISDVEFDLINGQFEAKHQCMLENNIVILRSNEYRMFLLYISQNYGKDYLKQFRVNNAKKT